MYLETYHLQHTASQRVSLARFAIAYSNFEMIFLTIADSNNGVERTHAALNCVHENRTVSIARIPLEQIETVAKFSFFCSVANLLHFF